MTKDAPPAEDEGGTGSLGAALEACVGAAALVDLDGGRLIAANEAAVAALALEPERGAVVVEGIGGLAADLAAAAGGRLRTRVGLRLADGALDAIADVSRAMIEGAPGLALIELREVRASLNAGGRSEPADGDGIAGGGAQGSAMRDDLATLQQIARRIREGLAVGALLEDAAPREGAAAAAVTFPQAASQPGERPGEATRERNARLAHELKTPLSAIVAAAEIMRDERLGPLANERYRSYAADIYTSARHALDVIGRMLGHGSGASAAAPEQSFAELDLNAIIESCVSSLSPLAVQRGLLLTATPGARLPRVVADATSVRQMALNLITNALKFTGAGGAIRVGTSYTLDGPVMVEVCDDGPGMSAAAIKAALTGEATGTLEPRPGGGLGIGLPLVRMLAELNGARLEIDSGSGEGTRARIVFSRQRVVPV